MAQYDVDSRHQVVDALLGVTLDEVGAAAPGNFQVPGNASAITEVRVHVIGDPTTDAVSACVSAVHLTGAGIGAGGGFYAFPGPGFSVSGVADESASGCDGHTEVYHTNIPVNAGGEIQAVGYQLEVDIGELHVGCTLVYDGIPGPIVDCDYRTVSLAAANTPVTLVNRGGVAAASFKTTGRPIVEVRPGGAMAGIAGPLSCVTNFHVFGAGLVHAGNYNFEGPSFYVGEEHDLGFAFSTNSVRHITNMPLKPGNLIDVEGMMVEDDVGTVEAICAFCYG